MSKPFVLLKLDKDYELRFDNRAGVTFEAITGKKINELHEIGLTDMNALIYAGIKKNNPDLTLDKVIDLIDDYADIQVVAEIIKKGFEQSNFFKIANGQKNQKS